MTSASALLAARQFFTQEAESASTDGSADRRRSAYDVDGGITYLNHASIGTVPRPVREAHARYLEVCESNPWLHVWGGAWNEAFEQAHAAAARMLGAEVDQVAIIRNTTAAFGMAANGLPIGRGHEVLFSSLNHTGASASWENACEALGYSVRRFSFPEADVAGLRMEDVTRIYVEQIRDGTEVLVLPHIDNIYGIRHDVKAIAARARERGVSWVLVDAAQSVGMVPVHTTEMDADVVATSAHKWVQASKGTGLMALSARAMDEMRPLIASWGQRQSLGTARAFTDFGTRDLPKVLSVGDAIRFHEASGEGRMAHHRALHESLRARVDAEPGLEWRSPTSFDEGGALVAIGLHEGSARDAAKKLFEGHGVVVRGFDREGRGHLRVSPNTMNDDRDLDTLFRAIAAL